jgi:hypothetical protein
MWCFDKEVKRKGEERSTLIELNCLAVESVCAESSMNASALDEYVSLKQLES